MAAYILTEPESYAEPGEYCTARVFDMPSAKNTLIVYFNGEEHTRVSGNYVTEFSIDFYAPDYDCEIKIVAKNGVVTQATSYIYVNTSSSGDDSGGSSEGPSTEYNPTIGSFTLTPIDINGNTVSVAVQGKTRIKASASGCSAGSGYIDSYYFNTPYEFNIVNTTLSSASTIFSAPTGSGTFVYNVRVYDSNGGSTIKDKSIYVHPYSAPYFTNFKAYRSNSSGVADLNGSYITYEYKVNYSAVATTNNITVKIYCNGALIKTASGASGKYTTTSTYNKESQHALYAVVLDSYGGSQTSLTENIYPSGRIFNIASSGQSIGIGGLAPTTSGIFGCYWNANFYKNVNVTGDLTVTGNLITDSISLPTIETGNFSSYDTSYSNNGHNDVCDGYKYTFTVQLQNKKFNSVPFVCVTPQIGGADGSVGGYGEYYISSALVSVTKTQFIYEVLLREPYISYCTFNYLAIAV